MVKKTIPLFLLLGAALLLSGCGNKFVPTEEEVKEDIMGQTLWLSDTERPYDMGINLTEENLKNAEILDKQSEGNKGSVIASLLVEMIEEEKGKAYKQHTFTVEVVIPYKLYKKELRVEGLIVNEPFNHQEKEVENLSALISSY